MPVLDVILAGPYNVAFTGAVLVALWMAHRAGTRDGVPPVTWAVVLAAALGGAIVGSKLIFLDFQPIDPGEKTVLGGIILGIGAVVVTARLLQVGIGRTLDALTVPTLVGMAIGRVGCILAGCCGGTATSLPWAVRDADGHAVHPVQLYEGAADLVLVGILTRVMRDRTSGARFHAATLGYAGIRFLTEFMREGRTLHAGLNLVQWSMLVIGAGFAVAAAWRTPQRGAATVQLTARMTARATACRDAHAPIAAAVLVTLLLALVTITGSWLVPLERLALAMLAGGVTATGMLAALEAWLPTMRTVLGPLTLAPRLGAVIVMQAQVEELPRRELIVGGSFARGAYEQVVGNTPSIDSCDGSPVRAQRERTVSSATLGVRQRLASGSRVTVEAQLLTGQDRLRSVKPGPTDFTPGSATLLGGGVALMHEARKASIRLGVVGGKFNVPGQDSGMVGSITVRNGDDRGWFAEGHLMGPLSGTMVGELSYVGVGYTKGRDRARAVVGAGKGGIFALHVPVRSFAVELAFRTIDPREAGESVSKFWNIGVRRAFAIR